jgi:hypothetical protein
MENKLTSNSAETAPSRLKRLLAVIAAFQKYATEANELLRKHLGLANPMYWRQAKVPQTGFLNSGAIRYGFHGIGCRIQTPSLVIDWDYGYEGRTDGFDLWQLQCFVEDSTPNYPEFRNQQVLAEAFQEAIEAGLIHQPYRSVQDNLYYLK